MPRPKATPEETKIPAPLRMRRRYLKKLREMAAAFGISPGEWVEAQVEPYLPKQKAPPESGEAS